MAEARSSSETLRVVIAGGGTGGHLLPGIALAEEMRRRWPVEILFVGTKKGVEARLLPKLGWPLHFVWIRGLRRSLSPDLLLFPIRLVVSMFQCAGLYRKFKPDAVIGTGGYVSGPALISALIMGIPTVIQEQNSYPGLVNRVLARYVRQVHVSFPNSMEFFRRKDNLFLSGNPVRVTASRASVAAARESFGLHAERPTLLVFGGSQGARAINRVLLRALPSLLETTDLQILWATGRYDEAEIQSATQRWRERIAVLPFIDRMPDAYRAADIVVARAGATTISEITFWGLPSILIPYPYATAGHQEQNARALAEAGAAWMILEKELTAERLVEAVRTLLSSSDRMLKMSQAARKLARPDAARTIVDHLATLLAAEGRLRTTNTQHVTRNTHHATRMK
jgi:UDP-N-acetylglucosamine--N-acetylmuramyl-(pentapeptide) pyrophosphoryl-undecaprenol N-acetylglucosamine transferase